MQSLTHHDITVILLSLGVLLLAARALGEVAIRLRQPSVIGEILAGVLLGPTVLGQIAPGLTAYLFPQAGVPHIVLEGIATMALVLFLLVAGMEVDLSAMFRQGRSASIVGLASTVVPLVLGLIVALLYPALIRIEGDASDGGSHFPRAMFFATAIAISSLPVIAKTLMDINLYRSDLGMVVIAAAIFNDVVGWLIIALVLTSHPDSVGHLSFGASVALTLGFVVVVLTLARWGFNRGLPWLQAHLSWPAGVLALVISFALACAAFTHWIGIHAVFGSFMAGVAVGDSAHLRQRTRTIIDQFISSIFAPLFFATIGLSVNFITHFDIALVAIVFVLATTTKLLACSLGARLSGMRWPEAWAVGFGLNARGAMGIILGLLGKQVGMISDELFVALVIMSVATSMISGSMMPMVLRRRAPRTFSAALHPKGFVNPLKSDDRDQAIGELAAIAAGVTNLPAKAIADAALQRERMMPTGLGLCVAVPHARVHGLSKPMVCLGISREGLEFNAPDGERSRMIFLILTPAEDDGAQLEILADISRTFLNAPMREAAMRANTYSEFIALLKTREPGDHFHGPPPGQSARG